MELRIATVLSFITAAITLPGFSLANSVWHPASSEAGVTYHPDRLKSTKTRADVIADVKAARRDGSLWFVRRGVPAPVRIAGPGRTREEVIGEMRNESAEGRRVRMELLVGG